MLKLIRYDEINTSKKAKVLFCSHPDDFNQFFETVSRDIHALNNCDIYYYDNGNPSVSDDWESDCFALNLIVIAISDHFLSEDNYAKNIYFYAQDKSIPVLPIMMEKSWSKNSITFADKFNFWTGQTTIQPVYLTKRNSKITCRRFWLVMNWPIKSERCSIDTSF